MPLDLYCATANPHKLSEFQAAAGESVRILATPPLDCPETGATFEENAVEKALCRARGLAGRLGGAPLLFADDSGIEVDALGGAPGIYSARFAGPDADDAANNALLLDRLRGVPRERRGGRFVCVIALLRGDELLGTFRGEASGFITEALDGEGGFGYDPLFHFPPAGTTFARLGREQKWACSHRGQAFRRLLAKLTEWSSAGRSV